ncbi:MAG: thiol-disulfide oxidoreductase DCC family protein [Cyclobacteriaceae bacterium]|nr:thiol-disulfide oxidoreductase DCC family protein [Cyclobacteriaceae bacterium]
MEEKSIVLFDGVCNLCNGFVNFLILRDTENKLKFGSLQSEAGQALLKKYNYSEKSLSTVVLIENNQLYSQSTAVLRILRRLNGAYSLMYVFMILPRFLRDFFYQLISKNRYMLFGKKDECMLPTPALKAKFIQ